MTPNLSFPEFFFAATGRAPFPFQAALAESTVLPELLTVPTGCGKTATIVLGWAWRRSAAPVAIRAATPRRLVYCLPVRTLVEQTVAEATAWLAKVAPGVRVHAMLGGSVDEDWEGTPDADALIVGTLDQLLSRALLRGYAMSPFRWPIHFALLHNDAWWVFDETQLMGPALSTSAQLEAFRRGLGTAMPARSTWMSATNAPGRLATVDLRRHSLRALGLEEADRAHPVLAARLGAAKRLVQLPASANLADEALARHTPGTRTLVVVNRVARAIELTQALRSRAKKSNVSVEVRLVHSRYRPGDRHEQQSAALGKEFAGIVVATQAIEAGVDLSSKTLLTDLASWSSLVQRFGRCNRAGEWSEADPATVVVVDVAEKDASPYSPEQLVDARERLGRLSEVGPQALASVAPEDGEPTLPVIRRKDLLELFDTEPDLAGRHLDISRYLRDGDERDVQVAWRPLGDRPPDPDAPALSRGELCSVGIDRLVKLLGKANAWRWDRAEGAWQTVSRSFGKPRLVPGEAVLVDVSVGGYDRELGFTGDPKHQPASLAPSAGASESDHDGKDTLSYGYGDFVTLKQHSEDVVAELQALLLELPGAPGDTLKAAARWHDLGKAHPSFQALLTASLAPDDVRRRDGPWAKSNGARAPRPSEARRFFRHELASALGWLAAGGDDLTAYLIAAHHGKVRLRLRSRPGERPEPGRGMPVLGVLDGDTLPEVELGGGVVSPAARLTTELTELGAVGGAWSERMLRLLDEHGPFRLAWWETLVRIADWRGSALRKSQLRESE